jgi:hypothetical protein
MYNDARIARDCLKFNFIHPLLSPPPPSLIIHSLLIQKRETKTLLIPTKMSLTTGEIVFLFSLFAGVIQLILFLGFFFYYAKNQVQFQAMVRRYRLVC